MCKYTKSYNDIPHFFTTCIFVVGETKPYNSILFRVVGDYALYKSILLYSALYLEVGML
jgi:hypothetical protein